MSRVLYLAIIDRYETVLAQLLLDSGRQGCEGFGVGYQIQSNPAKICILNDISLIFYTVAGRNDCHLRGVKMCIIYTENRCLLLVFVTQCSSTDVQTHCCCCAAS